MVAFAKVNENIRKKNLPDNLLTISVFSKILKILRIWHNYYLLLFYAMKYQEQTKETQKNTSLAESC